MNEHPIFHAGELALQKQSGVDSIANNIAKAMIRDFLPEQHQQFYPLLNSIFIASVDEFEKPWASIIAGRPGFIYVPDDKHLEIRESPAKSDILHENIQLNNYIGILGIDFKSRRRNRAAGSLVVANDKIMSIKITQAFGNCPKYIQARKSIIPNNSNYFDKCSVIEYSKLNDASKKLITNTDTFFIASYQPDTIKQGADISHRGGKPGFIQIINDDTIAFDDFSGNNLYMTLGNLYRYPYAGLLIIDYSNGDLWQLQCQTEIIDTPENENTRQIRLSILKIRQMPAALNMKWEFIDYSRFL